MIKQQFELLLEIKTDIFLEELKNWKMKEIQKNLDDKNQKKVYLDDETE